MFNWSRFKHSSKPLQRLLQPSCLCFWTTRSFLILTRRSTQHLKTEFYPGSELNLAYLRKPVGCVRWICWKRFLRGSRNTMPMEFFSRLHRAIRFQSYSQWPDKPCSSEFTSSTNWFLIVWRSSATLFTTIRRIPPRTHYSFRTGKFPVARK